MDPYTSTIFSEHILKIEERVTDLLNPFNLLTPRHSFIVITTLSGKKIKFEYNHEGLVIYDLDYQDAFPSSPYREHYLMKSIDLFRVIKKFENISYSQEFNSKNHNCQHVCRDFFKKISKDSKCLLVNDYLAKIAKYHLFTLNIGVKDDLFHKDIKPEHYKDTWVRSYEISDRKLERILKEDPVFLTFLKNFNTEGAKKFSIRRKSRFLIKPDSEKTKSIKRDFMNKIKLYKIPQVFGPKDIALKLPKRVNWEQSLWSNLYSMYLAESKKLNLMNKAFKN